MSGIEAINDFHGSSQQLRNKSERENRMYINKCLNEMKRMHGIICLGYGISASHISFESIESLGYTLVYASDFNKKNYIEFNELYTKSSLQWARDPKTTFPHTLLQRIFIPADLVKDYKF